MREGDIHPDLVNRLAEEAQRCADRALQMSIRAIDFCPPVGITFGDYLRAIVTADFDMYPADVENWRLAFIESFREWGIAPRGIRSMAEDSLLWPTEQEVIEERVTGTTTNQGAHTLVRGEPASAVSVSPSTTRTRKPPGERGSSADFWSDVRGELASATDRGSRAIKKMFSQDLGSQVTDEEYTRKATRKTTRSAPPPSPGTSQNVLTPVSLSMDRHALWLDAERQAALFHGWLLDEDAAWLADCLGLVVTESSFPLTISSRRGRPSVEIHSVRTVMRRGALGWAEKHLVVVVTQRRVGYFDKKKQADQDITPEAWKDPDPDFKYRAGCTLLIDPERTQIRRVVRTPGTVADEYELDRLRTFLLRGLDPPNAFDGVGERFKPTAEPFAFLHSQLRT
jgi:hypothetical protein